MEDTSSAVSSEVEALACAGNLDAQRQVREGMLLRLAEAPDAEAVGEWWMEAHFWARVAFVNGTAADRGALIEIIGGRLAHLTRWGNTACSLMLLRELTALLTLAADDGDEEAGAMLQSIGDMTPPEILRSAGAFAESWRPIGRDKRDSEQ